MTDSVSFCLIDKAAEHGIADPSTVPVTDLHDAIMECATNVPPPTGAGEMPPPPTDGLECHPDDEYFEMCEGTKHVAYAIVGAGFDPVQGEERLSDIIAQAIMDKYYSTPPPAGAVTDEQMMEMMEQTRTMIDYMSDQVAGCMFAFPGEITDMMSLHGALMDCA